jgi:hypothetical protein
VIEYHSHYYNHYCCINQRVPRHDCLLSTFIITTAISNQQASKQEIMAAEERTTHGRSLLQVLYIAVLSAGHSWAKVVAALLDALATEEAKVLVACPTANVVAVVQLRTAIAARYASFPCRLIGLCS